MKNWLVTGGAGFIGTNFLHYAARVTDATIVVLDVVTYAGNITNIQSLVESGRIKFVKGDICDTALLRELFASYPFDRVFHFAAETHVDRSILGPADFIHTNIQGTYCLLDAAHRAWRGSAGEKLFLHVSSDEVYGDLPSGSPASNENCAYRPSSPYAASKAASDHLVRAWGRTYGLPFIVTNCSNNYGPWQFPEKFIPLMIINAIENRELPVYGDGLQIRDWLHVDDHCEALMLVAQQGRVSETYNITSGNPRRNLSVVEETCDIVDKKLGRPVGASRSLIRHIEDRPGHDRRYAIDASKVMRDMNWRPRRGMVQGLEDAVEWYLAHLHWVNAIRTDEYREYYSRQYHCR